MTALSAAEKEIRRRILAEGPLPFHEFMRLALYHPQGGYYMRGEMTTGAAGDFSTSPDVSPVFGRRLAVQAAEAWRLLGGGSWRLVELGPGRGLLAADLLEGLRRHAPEALERLDELVLVEVAPGLARLQRERLEAVTPACPVRWVEGLAELEPAPGVVVANEFLDAMPVHLLIGGDEGPREAAVTLPAGPLVEGEEGPSEATVAPPLEGSPEAADARPEDAKLEFCEIDPDPAALELVRRFGLCREKGSRAEVCPWLGEFADDLARVLPRGLALVIDYGLPAAAWAEPSRRDGTLVAYHRHRVELDPLLRPGRQDLTAHVNWTHLTEEAQRAGFTVLGPAWQDRFLMALGLLEDLVADPTAPLDAVAEAERLSARALILPAGGGKRFEMLGLARDIGAKLRGWEPLDGRR